MLLRFLSFFGLFCLSLSLFTVKAAESDPSNASLAVVVEALATKQQQDYLRLHQLLHKFKTCAESNSLYVESTNSCTSIGGKSCAATTVVWGDTGANYHSTPKHRSFHNAFVKECHANLPALEHRMSTLKHYQVESASGTYTMEAEGQGLFSCDNGAWVVSGQFCRYTEGGPTE